MPKTSWGSNFPTNRNEPSSPLHSVLLQALPRGGFFRMRLCLPGIEHSSVRGRTDCRHYTKQCRGRQIKLRCGDQCSARPVLPGRERTDCPSHHQHVCRGHQPVRNRHDQLHPRFWKTKRNPNSSLSPTRETLKCRMSDVFPQQTKRAVSWRRTSRLRRKTAITTMPP